MTYEDFEKFVRERCMYETIYDDSDGRRILVIKLLDAYGMVNKAIEAAVLKEREAIAQSLDKQADLAADDIDRQWAMEMAAAVRARSNP